MATLPPHVLVAIDDAGAGYDSLTLVDSLRPAFMKLDRTTVTGIAIDAARQAFVGTLVAFAEEHGERFLRIDSIGDALALVERGAGAGGQAAP